PGVGPQAPALAVVQPVEAWRLAAQQWLAEPRAFATPSFTRQRQHTDQAGTTLRTGPDAALGIVTDAGLHIAVIVVKRIAETQMVELRRSHPPAQAQLRFKQLARLIPGQPRLVVGSDPALRQLAPALPRLPQPQRSRPALGGRQ